MQSIQKLYPNWSVQDTHGQAEAGDFHTIISGESEFDIDRVWILNEVKTHKSSIRTAEVKKFYRDIDKHKPPMAIMYSLYSNIVAKPHGHYEKRENTHVYFLSYVMNNPQCLEFVHKTMLRQWKESIENNTCMTHKHIEQRSEHGDEMDTMKTMKENEAKLKKQNQKQQVEMNNCIEYMLQRDQMLLTQYKKEIQQHTSRIKKMKNLITELEQHIKEYTNKQFEFGHYMNKTDKTNTNTIDHPYHCKRCNLFFKTKKTLLRHIQSNKHTGF